VHWQIDAGFYEFDFDKCKFKEFADEYNNQIKDLIDYWVDNIKDKKVLKLYPFLGIFESLYYGIKTKLCCGSGYANYTITTNGKISACPIMNSVENFYCGNLNSKIKDLKKIHCGKPCTECDYYEICGGRCLYSNHAKLWPQVGEKLICSTIIHLIEELKKRIPKIRKLIEQGIVEEIDFEYLKYFGPEIIP
jgi:radical SAM protein with 4Fe4S-binding SPASM domain